MIINMYTSMKTTNNNKQIFTGLNDPNSILKKRMWTGQTEGSDAGIA